MNLSLRKTVFGAALLFVFDAVVASQGSFSVFVLLFALFWTLPAAANAHKNAVLSRFRLRKAAILILAALAVIGTVRFNDAMAERRSVQLIRAAEQYKAKVGQYPKRLQDLAPEFIPGVPLAKYCLMWNDFGYIGHDDYHVLYYIAFPPYLRKLYRFETGNWYTQD